MASMFLSDRQFDQWVSPLRATLLREARCRCGPAEAPDLVQQALLAAWAHRDRFTGPGDQGALLAWLRRHLYYICQEHRRRLAVHPETLLSAAAVGELVESAAESGLSEQAYAAQRRTLYALLARISLTDKQKWCVRLWLKGHTQRQIAAHLGIRQRSVAGHIAAVKAKLRRAGAEAGVYGGSRHWFEEAGAVSVYRKLRR